MWWPKVKIRLVTMGHLKGNKKKLVKAETFRAAGEEENGCKNGGFYSRCCANLESNCQYSTSRGSLGSDVITGINCNGL